MFDLVLRAVLWALGTCMSIGSRFMPSVRSQVTRTMDLQFSAGKHVSRVWSFDAPSRRIRTRAGVAKDAECALHFATSRAAVGALLSARTVDRVVAGLQDGTVELHGSAFVVLWFYGLTRRFVRIGKPAGPRRPIPNPYLAHDDAAMGEENILIEPAVVRLDPSWTDAWRARSTLLQVRAATDEPVLEP